MFFKNILELTIFKKPILVNLILIDLYSIEDLMCYNNDYTQHYGFTEF